MGVVLVGQRGAEEREEAVAQELGHGPLVAVDLGQRAGEELLDEAGHRLGADPLGRSGGVDDVAEEGGDGLALALERAARREDLLRQMGGRVVPSLGAAGFAGRRHRSVARTASGAPSAPSRS